MKTEQNYSYPLNVDWTTEEITQVVKFYNAVEAAYEYGVEKNQLLAAYTGFKEIVSSKMEEKQLGKEFENASGYSIYRVVQAAKQTNAKRLKMKEVQ